MLLARSFCLAAPCLNVRNGPFAFPINPRCPTPGAGVTGPGLAGPNWSWSDLRPPSHRTRVDAV